MESIKSVNVFLPVGDLFRYSLLRLYIIVTGVVNFILSEYNAASVNVIL